MIISNRNSWRRQQSRSESALDHFTGGRVGWNIVTSYLQSAYRNGLGGDPLPHDERYARTDEFLTVCRGLWRQAELQVPRRRPRKRVPSGRPRDTSQAATALHSA